MGIYIGSLPYSSLKYSIPSIVGGSIILGVILYFAVYRDRGVWLGDRISACVWVVLKGFYLAIHAPSWAYNGVKERWGATTEGWNDWRERRRLESMERRDRQNSEKEKKRKEACELEKKRVMAGIEAIV